MSFAQIAEPPITHPNQFKMHFRKMSSVTDLRTKAFSVSSMSSILVTD